MTNLPLTSPDISEIKPGDLEARPFPATVSYRITIAPTAYNAICKHAGENTTLELCGVLVGEMYKDENGPYLEITDIIRGEHATNEGMQVTFTHETWAHISEIKDSKFSNKRIVGWYHTHPGFGVFLSDQDLFIHNNFFNQPWQVAFVIDPVDNKEGFFIWNDGKAIACQDYWVAGKKRAFKPTPHAVKKKMAMAMVERENAESQNNVETSSPYTTYLFLLIMVIITMLSAYQLWVSQRTEIQLANQESYLHALAMNQRVHNRSLGDFENDMVKALMIRIKEHIIFHPYDLEFKVVDDQIVCSGTLSTKFQKSALKLALAEYFRLNRFSINTVNIRVSGIYKTQKGDTLKRIAQKCFGIMEPTERVTERIKILNDEMTQKEKLDLSKSIPEGLPLLVEPQPQGQKPKDANERNN